MNNSRFDLGPKIFEKKKQIRKDDKSSLKKTYQKKEFEIKTKENKTNYQETEVENKVNTKGPKILKKGTRYKVVFCDYTHEGLGICKINTLNEKNEELTNFPVFVFGALKGEEGWIEITRVNKTYAYASLLTLFSENRSKYRNLPQCSAYEKCGGCNIMHMTYLGQLLFKEELIKETMKKIGGFENIEIRPIIKMDNVPLFYRNKVQVPVGCVKNKNICGFYKRDTHEIIPLSTCYIQSEEATEIVKFTKNILTEKGVKGYNEIDKTGELKHIILRKNALENEIMIVLVVKSYPFTTSNILKEIVDKIIKRYPNVKSIVANINQTTTNVILGNECVNIYGDGYITDQLCNLSFRIGPKSFYQVNHDQCEKLYKTAIELAKLNKDEIIIDAYCGIGTIGLIAANSVKEVYGVEIIDEAIKNAKVNAKINKITNATFVCGKAEEQIEKWMRQEIKPTTIFVDPPRKGCDEKFLETIVKMQINKVVYVSCDPATLARDIKYLSKNGYYLDIVQPVDMFPQTNHVECIVLLQRK